MAYKTRDELLKEIDEKNQEIKDLKKDIEKLDRYKVYEEGANEIAAVRDAYIAAGFSKTEAFTLTLKTVETVVITNSGSRVSYKKYY